MSSRSLELTPDLLLRAYAMGIFPMADSADATELHWFDPPIRALIPLDAHFHIPKRLQRTIRQKPYQVTLNKAFGDVMRACALPAKGRATTWINSQIISLYTTLHWRKHAHSIEVWDGKELVGGLYGVSLGAAFFGESMFSRKTDASKIALVYLVSLLRHCGFTLLDTQFQTEHLTQFGTHEITRANYHHFLNIAIKKPAELKLAETDDWDYLAGTAGALQPVTQIS
jgi:leucyl/phenylalanyl-tRNA--protein transferase